MAKQQSKLIWGFVLLGLGALWLLDEAGIYHLRLGFQRLALLLPAVIFAALALIFHGGFRNDPARRYGLLVPAGLMASLALMMAGFALHVLPHALIPLVIFAGPSLAFGRIYGLDHQRTWALFAAWFCAVIGVASFCGALGILGGGLSGAVFLWGSGLVFAWHFLRTGKDWAILPAGILLTLGFAPIFEHLPIQDDLVAAFMLLGMAASFAARYVLGRPGHSSWARYPAIVLGIIGILTAFAGIARPVFVYGLPLALIGTGIYLIHNAMRTEGADGAGNGPGTPPAGTAGGPTSMISL